ncbi:MAG: ATP-binding cassette domain-containing protein, partial [Termitinemataceae bacterium]
VEEDVAYGPEHAGCSRAETARRVQRALELVGLEQQRTRPVQFLSGGERQRLALAGILALDPPVLALDEAASMLDEQSRQQLLRQLDELWKQGRTIIHVTHNLEEASRAQRCIVLWQGCLVFNGSPLDLFVHPDLERWGFRPTPAVQILRAVRKCFPDYSPLSLDPHAMALSLAFHLIVTKEARVLSAAMIQGVSKSTSAAWNIGQRMVPSEDFNRSLDHRSEQSAGALNMNSQEQTERRYAVVCENLRHEYLRGTAYAAVGLQSVNLYLEQGVSLALVGPSGSGKSTLLRHLNGILLPTSGCVNVLGFDPADPSVDLRTLRKRAVLAVQNPESALFEVYAADDVAYGPRNFGITDKDLVERVRSAMDLVGLPYEVYRDRMTRQLSGGEKRRLALAGVLALDGDLVLLDEPLAALDGEGQCRVHDIIHQLKMDGKTVLASTHSMDDAATYDYIAVMQDGTLVAFGTPLDVFVRRWNPAWHIEQPWTVRFARELETQLALEGFFPQDVLLFPQRLADRIEDLAHLLQQCDVSETINPVQQLDDGKPEQDYGSAATLIDVSEESEAWVRMQQEHPHTRQRMRHTWHRNRRTGIEFFRNVTLGQFIDRPSWLREQSGGRKLAAATIILFAIILVPSWVFTVAILAGLLLAGRVLGRIEAKHLLRGLVPAAPYIIFMVLVQLLFPWQDTQGPVLWQWGWIDITAGKMQHILMLVSRLAALMALLSLYSAVTPLSESVEGIRKFVAPLGQIGLPVHDVIVITGIALRFVPLLVEEAERIVVAQLSRGGGYQGQNKIRAGMALVVPLFLRALERAEVLATAMELRLFQTEQSRS